MAQMSERFTRAPTLHDAATLQRWSRKPYAFATEALNASPDPWQKRILDALGNGVTRITIRSGNGVGKTTLLAWLAIWHVGTRYPSRTVCTAPTSQQLFDALWSEVRRWLNSSPQWLNDLFEVTSDRIALRAAPAQCFVSARTSRAETPEALQGVHSANVLLIVDEASGVAEQVFEAGSGSMSTPGAITVLAGNPLRSSGFFFRTHTDLSNSWLAFKVSCLDSRRVDPAWIKEQSDSYGPTSSYYQARVLGEFPENEDEVLCPRSIVLPATTRAVPNLMRQDYAHAVWGLDVARFGPDSTVLIKRVGSSVPDVPTIWRGADLMHIVGAVKTDYFNLPDDMRPQAICVDVIGLGSGVVDRMNELNLPVIGVNASESPSTLGQYYRLRDELYGRLRDWFASANPAIPDHARLINEVCAIRYRFTSDGRMRVESKDEMKRRGLASPDCADALALTHAVMSDTPMTLSPRSRRGLQPETQEWVV